MNKKNLFFIVALLFSMVQFATAQDVVGIWKTIDDETGKAKSYVKIYEKGGKYFGKVDKILTEDRQDAKCTKCKDKRKNQPILGLSIIENLKKVESGKYADGKILDPESGKVYALTATVLDNGEKLKISGGYKVFGKIVGRTQTWHKVN